MTFISGYMVSLARKDIVKVFDDEQIQELSSVRITENEAIKILKLLTKIVCDETVTVSKYSDKFFRITSQMLEVIQSEADVSILSCIYYLSKYFLKEKEPDLVLKLKSHLAKFKIEFSEAVVKVYYGLFFELHSFYKTYADKLSYDMKLQVRYGSLEILSLCGMKYLPTLMSETSSFISGNGIESLNSRWLDNVYNLTSIISKSLENIVTHQCEVVCKCYAQIVCNLVLQLVVKENSFLQKVLSNLNSLHSSSAVCNNIISFFMTSVKSIVNPELPLPVIKEQISVLNELLQYKPNGVLSFVCSSLSKVLFCIQAYWLNTLQCLSIDEFLLVSEMGMLLSQCISRNSSVGSNDLSTLNSLKCIIQNVSLGINVILGHVESIDGSMKSCNVQGNTYKVFDTLLTIQSKCIELLTVLRSHEKDEINSWKDFWKVLAQRFCSLASVLQSKCYYDYARRVYRNFCFAFFTLEQIDELDKLISPLELVTKSFKGLCQCLVESSKHKEALITLSIAVLLLPDKCTMLQKQWIVIKKNVRACENEELQLYTMFSTGQEINSSVKSLFPNIIERIQENFQTDIYRLLLWELQAYMMDKNQLSVALCEIRRRLIENPKFSMDYAECIEYVMRGVEIRLEESSSEFSDIYQLGVTILENLEKNTKQKNWQIFSMLGNIHFYKFWTEVIVLRKQLHADVICMEGKFPTKEEKSVMKGLIDPSEAEMKSNIVTAYAGLNILKEQELLKYLQQAAEVWSKILNTKIISTKCSEEKWEKLLNNMKLAAYTFDLYGYFIHSMKIWVTYYLISKSLKNDAEALFALSHLLAYTCCTPEAKLWKKGEKIAGELEQQNLGDKHTKVLLIYWLAKCNSCMLNDQFAVGWQYLEKLNDSSLSTFLGHFGSAKKYLLLSKYYIFCSHPSKVPKVFQEDDAFGAIGQVFKYLKALNKEKAFALEYSCFHSLFMETAVWMGDLCLGTKQYRGGYSYLKHYLLFSQKLGLASRSSQIVSKLAKFDLLCWEVDNLQVKLLGLETTLCLNDSSLISLKCYETCMEKEDIKNQKKEFILHNEFAEMKLLDVPTSKCNILNSPVLEKSPFKKPFMANHKEDCDCLCCSSSLIQSLFIDSCLFQAKIDVFKGENERALSFFEGGLKLYDHFRRRQERIAMQINRKDFHVEKLNFLPIKQELNSSCFKLSMSYKEFLFLSSKNKKDLEKFICLPTKDGDPQELNLHFILEAVDQIFFMVSEINKSPTDDHVKDVGADEFLNELTKSNEASCAGVKTPTASSVKLNHLPILHRNEDHRYISKAATPSIKINLKSKLNEAMSINKSPKEDEEIDCIFSSVEENRQKSSSSSEEKVKRVVRKKKSIFSSDEENREKTLSTTAEHVKVGKKKKTRRRKNQFILE